MLAMSIRDTVISEIRTTAAEQDRKLPTLTDSMELVDTGLDSLCFAILVARLEEKLGVDPFEKVEVGSYPVTLGDFIKLYDASAR
jgi:acyl carrier protein